MYEKIGVDIFAVDPDISFGNIKSEKITEISLNNIYNRNNRFNMNKLQKMFKMDSFFIEHKA